WLCRGVGWCWFVGVVLGWVCVVCLWVLGLVWGVAGFVGFGVVGWFLLGVVFCGCLFFWVVGCLFGLV
ncbi:hypothetical protein, partial [Neisseria sp. P0018.S006]|uniref:hypothetical protein n=1 Tax=Neisseria sp. P0018.S006 TaxID=3436792 RepID=UPI003F802CEE